MKELYDIEDTRLNKVTFMKWWIKWVCGRYTTMKNQTIYEMLEDTLNNIDVSADELDTYIRQSGIVYKSLVK